MSHLEKMKTDGISLRAVHSFLIVIAALVSAILLYATSHSSATFERLSDATNEFIDMQEGTRQLLDASDYLTDQVQLFAIDGERAYLDNYFTEAYETRRREAAIELLSKNLDYEPARRKLQDAMDSSVALSTTNCYFLIAK